MKKNENLRRAKREKNDEFYTMYEDIEKEVQHYKEHLAGEVIYCNCDDYRWSNFFKFFKDHFEEYELAGLLCSGLKAPTVYYDGEHLYKAVGHDDKPFQDDFFLKLDTAEEIVDACEWEVLE